MKRFAKQVTVLFLRKGMVAKATIPIPKFLAPPMRELMWCRDLGPFHIVTQTVRWNVEAGRWDLHYDPSNTLQIGARVKVISGSFRGEVGEIFGQHTGCSDEMNFTVDFDDGGGMMFSASELRRID